MDRYHFRYATTLTCVHLLATFLLLLLTARLGVFEIKPLPLRNVAKLAAGTMGFICLTNLSLQHNSVGFFQTMKVLTTPVIVVIEAFLYQKYLDSRLKLALLPVCLGVIATTVTDFRLNFVGAAYATAAVIVTSFYQIWSGTLQKSLDCNALQLQTFVAPLAAVFILPFIPLFDNYSWTDDSAIWNYPFTSTSVSLIALTAFLAFFVNVSIFLVIGRSSPVSYNVLGHCKTVFILGSDFVLFGRPATLKSSTGILLTLIGVFWYTSVKLKTTRQESDARSRTSIGEKAAVELNVGDVEISDASDDEDVVLLNTRRD
jgi:solute carrier family 35, member E3